MSEKLNKYLQIVLYVILGVSLILYGFFYINGESMTDAVLIWAYILLGLTVVLLLVFPVLYFIKNPKAAIKFLIVLVGFAILFGIGYLLASGDINAPIFEKQGVTSNTSRLVGAGMITTYILAGIAVLAIIYSSISSVFNKK